MNKQNLAIKLMVATIESMAIMTKSDSDLRELLYSIFNATQHNLSFGMIQFEDVWQETIDNDEDVWIVVRLKLSPHCLRLIDHGYSNLNTAVWQVYLPNINYLEADKVPKSNAKCLAMAKLSIVEDHKAYEDEELLNFLDRVNFLGTH
jgi:hypothetical protein